MSTPTLYSDYFVKKSDERMGLFRALTAAFNIQRGLYPGSFVHITPSFFIPEMVYVDMDKRCPRFFADDAMLHYVAERKQYAQLPSIKFYHADFSKELPEAAQSFDLLLSFYAGFISEYCTRYLRPRGILVANNSHGDAPLAYLNPHYRLIGVVSRRAEQFKLTFENLDAYFVTKSGNPLDKAEILTSMRGPRYTKAPYAYIFQKV